MADDDKKPKNPLREKLPKVPPASPPGHKQPEEIPEENNE